MENGTIDFIVVVLVIRELGVRCCPMLWHRALIYFACEKNGAGDSRATTPQKEDGQRVFERPCLEPRRLPSSWRPTVLLAATELTQANISCNPNHLEDVNVPFLFTCLCVPAMSSISGLELD